MQRNDVQILALERLKSLFLKRIIVALYLYQSLSTGNPKLTLRAEPPFVFFFPEEEKSRLCTNHVNSLKQPQPELLD